MALGTFVLTISGERQDGTPETKARLHLRSQGVDTLIDTDADEFRFPTKFAKSDGVPISLPYSLTLDTDSVSGESTSIGYEGFVKTDEGRIDFEIAAQESGTTRALADLTDEVVVPISSIQVYRDEAEAAADLAAASAATIKPLRTQTTGTLTATPVDDGGRTICWLDATRTRLFASNRNVLRYSDDESATWVDVPGFKTTYIISAVRDMDNGEIVVFAGPSPASTAPAAIWVSNGFRTNPQTATFRKVKTASAVGVYFSNSWGICVHRNLVFAAEYGPKGGGANARYLYMSRDYGQTWTTIYDVGSAVGNHLHGVAFDPYWDRIWLTYGDDTSGIVFSDTMGDTWNTAQSTAVAAGDYQSVGIVVLPQCVLFASDGQPNGIHRIPRTATKKTTSYAADLETPVQIDAATTLTWLGHMPFRAQRAGDDAPVLFPFAPELSTGKSKVYATKDGYDFDLIWEDTIDTTSRGALVAVGPTTRGRIHIVSNDGRQANYSKWSGPMPVTY